MSHRFEIYKDKVGEHRVRFIRNGETIFSTTESYSSKSGAKKAIEDIRKLTADASVTDTTI